MRDTILSYANIGEKKSQMSFGKTFVLSIFAGMFIALAGLASTIGSSQIADASVARVVSGIIFPAGLAMVVLCGTELFTGDCLMITSVLLRKISVLKMIRTLVIVYVGNLVGSLLVCACAVYGHTLSMFGGELAQTVVNTAAAKANMGFVDGLLRGIMCNVLVCVAVLMAMMAKTASGKVVALFLPIMVFVICGFEHSVANMFYIPAGIMASKEYAIAADGLDLYGFAIKNELPVTIGNIIGGFAVGIPFLMAYKEEK